MHIDPVIARLIVAGVVVGWVAMTIVSALNPEVEVPASLNGVFMLIAGVVATQLKGSETKKPKDSEQVQTKGKDATPPDGGDSE